MLPTPRSSGCAQRTGPIDSFLERALKESPHSADCHAVWLRAGSSGSPKASEDSSRGWKRK